MMPTESVVGSASPRTEAGASGLRLPPIAPVPPLIAAFIMREIPSARWRSAFDGARATNPAAAAQYEQAAAYLRAGKSWHVARIRQLSSVSGSAEVGLAEVGGDSDCSSLDTAEVGRRLGVSPRWVRALIESGMLRASRVGRAWRIDSDSVEEYLMRTTP